MNQPTINPIKTLPWGEEIYLELPLHQKKSTNRFYARHGKNSDGHQYIEFSKFGPKPGSDERFLQKLRLYDARQWAQIKHYVENELAKSIGWDLKSAQDS